MQKYDKVFFLHIPKTAGTSFNSMFRPLFSSDRYFDHMESRPELFKSLQSDGFPFFISGHLNFEFARSLIERKDVFTITILREPISQLISHLKWVKYVGSPKYPDPAAIDPEILEFSRDLFQVPLNDTARIATLLDHPVGVRLFDNLQVRYLSDPVIPRIGKMQRRIAVKNIEKFKFLFTLDDMNLALKKLTQIFPGTNDITVCNVAQIEDEVDLEDPKVVDFYRRRTVWDRELYSAAREFSLRFHLSDAKAKMRWLPRFALGN
ncbi:MAG: hypothetical protein EOQ50_15010 [Mesorhizobium sp.]|uniref:sulfotransferase family 2 domain-containing protein n=1 Tax=Mesorhizobium sp. TaxID=1871066 RepID=UPI000FE4CE84|nr:sulfotransferase family 2 domain-containing protein [Mesorhizobium sp.]RWB74615.1 MAG: hypothetical protein EOQ50_15010 [Mesorhizobium sp.]